MRIIIIRLVTTPPPSLPPDPEPAETRSGTDSPPRIESATLFGRARELVILHAGREYHLRVTQNGKLILTA